MGGATRMPAVVERVRTILEKPPQQRLDPDLVVALGAAVQAGLIGKNEAVNDLVVTDVAPFTLGIETCKQLGMEHRSGYMLPIIHRNTTIPISRVKRVNTVAPNQTQIAVKVFQGENRLTKHNVVLGEFTVDRIPKGPPGQEVDIRFTYDLNGVLEVEATVVETHAQSDASDCAARAEHVAGTDCPGGGGNAGARRARPATRPRTCALIEPRRPGI